MRPGSHEFCFWIKKDNLIWFSAVTAKAFSGCLANDVYINKHFDLKAYIRVVVTWREAKKKNRQVSKHLDSGVFWLASSDVQSLIEWSENEQDHNAKRESQFIYSPHRSPCRLFWPSPWPRSHDWLRSSCSLFRLSWPPHLCQSPRSCSLLHSNSRFLFRHLNIELYWIKSNG